MARSNQGDRDRGGEQPGMTDKEMVGRFLEEYEGADTQEYGSGEQEVMDRFIATYRPPQRGNSDSGDVTDDIEQPETAEERNARYQRSSHSETSDPDHWMMLHHGDYDMSYDSDNDSRYGSTRNPRIPEVVLGPTVRRRIGRRDQIYSTTCPWLERCLEQQLNRVTMSMISLAAYQVKMVRVLDLLWRAYFDWSYAPGLYLLIDSRWWRSLLTLL